MVPEPGLSPSEIRNLKLILSMSSSYYAKILPLYRESLEHRRFRRGKVKNFKGLQVKIYPTRCVAVTGVSPLVPASYAFPVSPAFTVQPQPSKHTLKRRAPPVESTIEPPSKKLRKLTDATAIGVRLPNLVPLLKRLQKSLILPSRIMSSKGRWLVVKQRDLVSLDGPPQFPEDLLTIKVPPVLKISHPSK